MASEAEPYSMLEWVTVERARMADGTEFVLGRHGDGWVIRVGARILMSNRMHGSEEALAAIALARVDKPPRTVLVGGLGLGYTVRAVLDAVGPKTEVTVLELVPELVDWNRSHVGQLAGHPLDDPRCRVVVGDVFDTLKKSPATFDVIVLDVDNGPQGLTQAKNKRLYSESGVRSCLAALRPGGVLAVWSAGPNARYHGKLERHAADVEVLRVPARFNSRTRHIVFVAKPR
jgi:spermidine synthase